MKKVSIKLLGVLLFMFLFISNVNATSLGLFDETVNQEGEYNSVRFIGGNNVNNKAIIDGISFGFGNNITASGEVEYGVYAGNVININENVKKDLFAAGNNITVVDGAVLGRDVFIAGNNVTLYANVTRDLRAGGSVVSIKGITIGGDAIIDADKIVLDENTTITGKLSYPVNATVEGLNKDNVGSIETWEATDVDMEEVTRSFNAYMFITWLVAAIVTMLILLSVCPGLREKLNKTKLEGGEIFKTAMIGLGVLVCVPFISIFTIFTGLLTPITLIVLAIYCICIYLAKLFVAYVIGTVIMKQGFKVKKDRYVLSILIGVTLVRLLCLIPVLGGLLSFILLIYGLGLIYVLIKTNINKK